MTRESLPASQNIPEQEQTRRNPMSSLLPRDQLTAAMKIKNDLLQRKAMKATTSIKSALSAPTPGKSLPKRAVSFAKACKYRPPSRAKMPCTSDDVLQSTDSRRRYHRRGSKTPAMLVLSRADIATIESATPTEQAVASTVAKERRLSLMTALKQNLERSCKLEPAVAKTIRRLSFDATGVMNSSCSRTLA